MSKSPKCRSCTLNHIPRNLWTFVGGHSWDFCVYPLTQNYHEYKHYSEIITFVVITNFMRNSLKGLSLPEMQRRQNPPRTTKNNSRRIIFIVISQVFLNRVQQTVSGNTPAQHSPDTTSWTLFRCSLRV